MVTRLCGYVFNGEIVERLILSKRCWERLNVGWKNKQKSKTFLFQKSLWSKNLSSVQTNELLYNLSLDLVLATTTTTSTTTEGSRGWRGRWWWCRGDGVGPPQRLQPNESCEGPNSAKSRFLWKSDKSRHLKDDVRWHFASLFLLCRRSGDDTWRQNFRQFRLVH